MHHAKGTVISVVADEVIDATDAERDGVPIQIVRSAFDRSVGAATYARVTPGLHFGLVSVSCKASGAASTRVEVSYDLTALETSDPDVLAPYSEQAFNSMLVEWQQLIARHVASL